ncbi:hypothetical protein pb186bvf_021191 [Paramecium bursaria]
MFHFYKLYFILLYYQIQLIDFHSLIKLHIPALSNLQRLQYQESKPMNTVLQNKINNELLLLIYNQNRNNQIGSLSEHTKYRDKQYVQSLFLQRYHPLMNIHPTVYQILANINIKNVAVMIFNLLSNNQLPLNCMKMMKIMKIYINKQSLL